MSSFTEDRLRDKLNRLSPTMQSIQSLFHPPSHHSNPHIAHTQRESRFCLHVCTVPALTHWVIFHKRHCNAIVDVWYRALVEAPPERKLSFVYLANDIVQTSRKSSPEFERAFEPVVADACAHIVKEVPDAKTRASLLHTVRVWRDRSVFDPAVVRGLLALLEPASSSSSSAADAPTAAATSASSNSSNLEGVVAALPDVEQGFARDVLRQLPDADAKQRAAAACAAAAHKYDAQLFTGALLAGVRDKTVLTNIACDFEEAVRCHEALQTAQSDLLTAKSALADTLVAYTTQLQSELVRLRDAAAATRATLAAVPALQAQMASLYVSLPDAAPSSSSTPPPPSSSSEQEPDAKRPRTDAPPM